MNSRKIIAATVLGLIGGAAFAEGESHIDFTAQHLNSSRAEVMAETRSFNATHGNFLSHSSEAYGDFDATAAVSSSSANDSHMADTAGTAGQDFRGNEAYGGFPQVDGLQGRGE